MSLHWHIITNYLVAQMVKNLPAMQETWDWSLGWEDPLEKGMAMHFSILAWRVSVDRGAWWATVHGGMKSQTWLSDRAQSTVYPSIHCWLPLWLSGEESACSAGDTGDSGSIPRSKRSLGGGYSNPLQYSWAFQVVLVLKDQPANAGDTGDLGSIPRSGRFLGVGNGNPLPYSCLENSIDREAYQTTVHETVKSQTWLHTHTHTFIVGIVHSVDLYKCIMMYTHHYNIIQSLFPVFSLFIYIYTLTLATTDLLIATIFYPFPEIHIVGIIQYVAFSD